MKRGTIQDIHNFREQVFDVLQEYLNDVNLYPADSCLIINKKRLDVFIDNVINAKKCDVYPISSLTRLDEDNLIEPDVDGLNSETKLDRFDRFQENLNRSILQLEQFSSKCMMFNCNSY